MNISIYLPDSLEKRLQEYLEKKGINRNMAIRQALETMLEQEQPRKWGNWINELESDPAFEPFESYRSDLKDPDTNPFG
ncbi:MAG: ribbon-helix-helix domain-containing protein [Bacteroidota bacterium]